MSRRAAKRSSGEKTDALERVLARCRGGFVAVGVFSFAINLLVLTVPLYMLQVYDRVLTARSYDTLIMLTILAVGFLLLTGLLEAVRARVLVRAGARIDTGLNRNVFKAVLRRRLGGYEGSHAEPIRDLETVRTFLTGNGLLAFFDAPWTPLFIALIFVMHPLLGAIALGGALLLLVLGIAGDRLTRPLLGRAAAASTAATGFAESTVRNAEAIEAMGMHRPGGQVAPAPRTGAGGAGPDQRPRWPADRDGQVPAPASAGRGPGQRRVSGDRTGDHARGDDRCLDHHGAGAGADRARDRRLARLRQCARGLWPAARDAVDVSIAAGGDVPAQAARSPCGRRPRGGRTGRKAGLLARDRFRPAAGAGVGRDWPQRRRQVDAGAAIGRGLGAAQRHGAARRADVSSWSRANLGPHIGYLPEDVELFDGTVADNIARFGPADPTAVVAAARRAGVHDMILQLPNGYDTVIGDGGVLSGGQRQRIGLARALFGDPSLIVLDEPNAHLDTEGEEALRRAIVDLKKADKTLVIVSHRPAALAVIDYLLVLRDGRMQAYGPRREVLSKLTRAVATDDKGRQDAAASASPAGA